MNKALQPLRTLRRIVWGQPPDNPVARSYLFKLDAFVLSYVCLLYWANYLDRANLANAYVSGMQEDLQMKGNELNIINTCFYVGYIVAMVPHNLILLKVRPRYWISICGFCWAVLTLSMYKVHLFKQLCVIRFFEAMFEAVTFAGTHLILGTYYDEELLPMRTAVFTSSGLLGSLFSGVLQAAIYKNMEDYNGIRGWRWLFIIDFLITIPIVIFGFFCFPDEPQISKPFYMTNEEHQLALEKKLSSKDKANSDWNWVSICNRVFRNWHWYLFSFLWVLGGENESFVTNSLMPLWLKYYNYSVEQRNHYPMGQYAVGVVATIILALYIHAFGKGRHHWHMGIIIGIFTTIAAAVFAAKPNNTVAVFVSQYLSAVSFAGQTVFFSWANVVCINDLQERAIVLASMNMFSNAVNAWWSILFYGADTAPEFKKGCWALLATAIASIGVVVVIQVLQAKDKHQSHNDDTGIMAVVMDGESDEVELGGPIKV